MFCLKFARSQRQVSVKLQFPASYAHVGGEKYEHTHSRSTWAKLLYTSVSLIFSYKCKCSELGSLEATGSNFRPHDVGTDYGKIPCFNVQEYRNISSSTRPPSTPLPQSNVGAIHWSWVWPRKSICRGSVAYRNFFSQCNRHYTYCVPKTIH